MRLAAIKNRSLKKPLSLLKTNLADVTCLQQKHPVFFVRKRVRHLLQM